MKIHHLKTLPEYFREVKLGNKTYEVRKDDRNFQVNDIVILKEWSLETKYTGETYTVLITHKLPGSKFPDGIKEDYCILSIRPFPDKTCGECGKIVSFGEYFKQDNMVLEDALYYWRYVWFFICSECRENIKKFGRPIPENDKKMNTLEKIFIKSNEILEICQEHREKPLYAKIEKILLEFERVKYYGITYFSVKHFYRNLNVMIARVNDDNLQDKMQEIMDLIKK